MNYVLTFCLCVFFYYLFQRPPSRLRPNSSPVKEDDTSGEKTKSSLPVSPLASSSPPAASTALTPPSLSESMLPDLSIMLPDLSELSTSSDELDIGPPPGPPVIDDKPPLPSMSPSSPIFEEESLPSPVFSDGDTPPWLLDDIIPVQNGDVKKPEPVKILEAKTPPPVEPKSQPKLQVKIPSPDQYKTPLKTEPKSPPKTEVKTPPPVLAKPKRKPPAQLPPFAQTTSHKRQSVDEIVNNMNNREANLKTNLKTKNSKDLEIITNGLTNGTMSSIGSPEMKNRHNKLFDGVEVKPYRSSSSASDSSRHKKQETEVRLNPSFCVDIAEKRVLLTKPRSTSLDFPVEKLDSNQNKTKSLVIYSQTHATQTDPVNYDLRLANAHSNGHCFLDNQFHIDSKPKKSSTEKPKVNGHLLVNGCRPSTELEDIFSDNKRSKPPQKRSTSLGVSKSEKEVEMLPRTHSVDTPEQLFSKELEEHREPIITGEMSMPECMLDNLICQFLHVSYYAL